MCGLNVWLAPHVRNVSAPLVDISVTRLTQLQHYNSGPAQRLHCGDIVAKCRLQRFEEGTFLKVYYTQSSSAEQCVEQKLKGSIMFANTEKLNYDSNLRLCIFH